MTSLAQALWEARVAGRPLAVTPAEKPQDEAEGYRLQADMIARAGGALRGWKLGATSTVSQVNLKTAQPFYGPLIDRFCHDKGAVVPAPAAFTPGIEVEFALELGSDVAPRAKPYTGSELGDAVAAVIPALEFAGSRVAGGIPAAGICTLIADCGGNVAFVAGPRVTDWRRFDLAGHACRLRVNGVDKVAGSGAAALGHPLDALAWFVNAMGKAGQGMKNGWVISTGTCTGFVPVQPGDRLEGDFGDLGRVSATVA